MSELRAKGKITLKIPQAVFAFCLFMCLVSCIRLGLAYVETNKDTGIDPSNVIVNYFFDRTESIRPFTYKADTGYSLAMNSLLTVGQDLFGSDPLNFYDFAAELRHIQARLEQIQVEIQKPAFYLPDRAKFSSSEVIPVIPIGGLPQPFFTVAEYIRENHRGENTLNIITTDLYEQNNITQYFHTFFRNAFARGLSGAIFAIKSEFKGNIYNISASNRSLQVNGYSTIFVFITGKKNILQQFCSDFSKKMKAKSIIFNQSVFLLGDSPAVDVSLADSMITDNLRRYEAAMKENKTINLRRVSGLIKTWQMVEPNEDTKKGISFVSRPADVEAYRIMGRIGARYIKPTGESGADNLSLIDGLSLEYFNGGKTEPGKPSEFKPEISGAMITPSVLESDGSQYVAININTPSLKSGYYRIKYNIIPGWVLDLDAGEGGDGYGNVQNSYQPGGLPKVLHLKSIYEDIVRDFNRENSFSGLFYLVKEK